MAWGEADMAERTTRGDGASGPALTWALCVATLDRIEVLEASLRLALKQTRMPAEVIVVDASADWAVSRDRLAGLMAAHGGVRFAYAPAPKRSLTVQRNAALARARADVLFFFDDDSLMYPDCAAEIMRVYEADRGRKIAGVSAVNAARSPLREDPRAARKARSAAAVGASGAPGWRSAVDRFVRREVLLMATNRRFVKYGSGITPATEADVAELGIEGIKLAGLMSGYTMTVRREVAAAEGFDGDLLGYAAAEDLDASYRFSRHGLIVSAPRARLHHFEAAASRLKRKKAKTLGLTNVAYVVRKRSDRPRADAAAFWVLYGRTLLAEFLKDLLSRRFDLPQLRGALSAAPLVRAIFAKPRQELRAWYQGVQERILNGTNNGAAQA